MKYIITLFAGITMFSCSSQKNVPGPVGKATSSDTAIAQSTGSNETKAATPTKTIILNNTEKTDKVKTTGIDKRNESNTDKLPTCLQKLVKQFMEEEVQNPPRKIYSCLYNGQLVYYVTPPCCDFFSDLYDSKCNLIAHPDGGITGRGDGRAKDFAQTKTQEKLVWEDVRRYR